MQYRKMLILLLIGVGLSACGSTDVTTGQAQPVSITIPAPQTEAEVSVTTPTTTPVVEDPTTVEADEQSDEPVVWPEVGIPTKLVIEGVAACTVYPHTPEESPAGIFSPRPDHIGLWTGSGYSKPGEQGYSLLAGHVTDCFKQLAAEAEVGTEVLVEDDSGNVIVLEVTEEAVRYHKQQIPWQEVIRGTVSEDQAVTWLFTCGGEERRADGHRVYNDVVRTEVVQIYLASGEVWSVPQPEVVAPGGSR